MPQNDQLPSGITPNLDELCGKGMSLQLAGQVELAERTYRAILLAAPSHAAANHCLGMLKVQGRHPRDALPHLLRALETDPTVRDYWLGYLEALLLAGYMQDAEETLALARGHGLAGAAVENYARRLESARQAPAAEVPAQPSDAVDSVPGEAPLSRAARRRKDRLGREREDALIALLKGGRFADALAGAIALTQLFPERGLGWKTLGALLAADKRHEEAVAAMRTSVSLLPEDAEAHSNLGATLVEMNRMEEAESCLLRALTIDRNFAAAHAQLGNVYQVQGRYPEAEASLRSAIALKFGDSAADHNLVYSSVLFMLSHNPNLDADSLFAEHCRVGDQLEGEVRAHWPNHKNSADPDRTLQVGIVSGDLFNHPVAAFIEPLLAEVQHDARLEMHAYYNNPIEDDVSARLRGYVRHWNSVFALSDAELAHRIKNDRIDILLDLSGHTSLNRLRTFARKPAPVQASWIGYPGTTGLRAMDYFLADPHFLPPGQFDKHFTEKLVYLPAQTPFRPHESAPPVNALPALSAGHITFGSFNRLGKISAATVSLWSQLLRRIPTARMILAGIPLDSQHLKLIERFRHHGIAPERLTCHPRCAMESYLALHHQVDLCLDTMPYCGGTTTIHALWMGVPTLTLAGPTPAARSGAAIMGQLGLHEFIAHSAAQFVDMGEAWANDLTKLAQLRAALRMRWMESPGRRPEVIAAEFTLALRRMWRRWCAKLPAESFRTSDSEPLHE
jgi:predicted O-linked N-acetylglucosamine transferase (SPINDLY family)